jgi:phosphonate transport system substrate-binding protein
MNEVNQASWARIIKVLIPLILLMVVLYAWWSNQVQATAKSEMSRKVLSVMLGESPTATASTFTDADGDLLADTPAADKCIAPDTLIFAYIAEDESDEAETKVWNDLVLLLSEKLGRKVEVTQFATTAEQADALRDGKLHITGFNTGAVEAAVNQAGFVPFCTIGSDDGTFGYTMKIIVPASSNIRAVEQLRGKQITFTRPTSNSGFKAAFELLANSYAMLPERDYDWSFSLDHDKSILRVAGKKTDSAAVASDVLAKLIENGEADVESIRTVYESERFPPAAIGFAYNLTPEIQATIRNTLLGMEFKGTSLEEEFIPMGATRFVPVNYKDDWANIRRIDQSIDKARVGG